MMRCSHCGAPAVQEVRRRAAKDWVESVDNRCGAGHRFLTLHVHPSMIGDAGRMLSAVRALDRRVALWARNASIVADPRAAAVVAAQHGITPTRVRQIRASALLASRGASEAKSLPSTQKGRS